MSTDKKASHRLVKWRQIMHRMKHRITVGDWKPGQQLPSYDALELQFDVGRVTIQQVINRLKADGFLTSKARQGVFVCENPPHLNNIGILLPGTIDNNFFWNVLCTTAAQLGPALNRKFVVYENLGEEELSQPELDRLRYDIHERRLAGLVFVFPVERQCPEPGFIINNPLPKIALSDCGLTNAYKVYLDNAQLARKGVDWLVSQGCERVAFFARKPVTPLTDAFRTITKDTGLYSPDFWQLPIHETHLAAPLVQLLMSLPENERPQGLFIGDDNLIDDVIRGVVASGVRVPQQLKIVSHCNWRSHMPLLLPIRYVGYELEEIVVRCAQVVESAQAAQQADAAGIANLPLPLTVTIPALFAEERVQTSELIRLAASGTAIHPAQEQAS